MEFNPNLYRPFFIIRRVRNAEYSELVEQNDVDDDLDHRSIQMQNQRNHRRRFENVLEAQIQPGDTLQAISLRYNCTVSINNRSGQTKINANAISKNSLNKQISINKKEINKRKSGSLLHENVCSRSRTYF